MRWLKIKISKYLMGQIDISTMLFALNSDVKRTKEDEVGIRLLDSYMRYKSVSDIGICSERTEVEKNDFIKSFNDFQKLKNPNIEYDNSKEKMIVTES